MVPRASAHYMYRKGSRISPLFPWRRPRGRGLAPVRKNVPGIAGFGLAAKITASGIEENLCGGGPSKNRCWSAGFVAPISNTGSTRRKMHSHIIKHFLQGMSWRKYLLHHLEQRGICLTPGALFSHKKSRSHVLKVDEGWSLHL